VSLLSDYSMNRTTGIRHELSRQPHRESEQHLAVVVAY
jgi:hypothetical protein